MKIDSIFGVPKELKQDENRVALTPDSTKILTDAGYSVYVEKKRGFIIRFYR